MRLANKALTQCQVWIPLPQGRPGPSCPTLRNMQLLLLRRRLLMILQTSHSSLYEMKCSMACLSAFLAVVLMCQLRWAISDLLHCMAA